MRKDLYKELFEVEDKHWWHDHKRKVIHQVMETFANKRVGRVLDVGAGTGKMLEELKAKKWQVFGVDGSKEAVKWSGKRGIEIKLANVENKLPFKNAFFDVVLGLDVVEHLDDPNGTLREVFRVLKPKGVMVITVPAYQRLFNYWDKMLGHKLRYSAKNLKRLVTKSNFETMYLSYFNMFILLPSIIVRWIKLKTGKTKTSDFLSTPFKNISVPTLKLINSLERVMLSFTKLPFGLSVICVIRKK